MYPALYLFEIYDDVNQNPISRSLESLVAAGFRSRRDVLQCTSARELAHETKLSVQESIQVLGLLNQRQHREEREVAKTSATSAFTAHDALSSNRLLSHIHGLDELLGGGFVRGQVIEFCGRPGWWISLW